MNREIHVRICGGLEVRFLWATRHPLSISFVGWLSKNLFFYIFFVDSRKIWHKNLLVYVPLEAPWHQLIDKGIMIIHTFVAIKKNNQNVICSSPICKIKSK